MKAITTNNTATLVFLTKTMQEQTMTSTNQHLGRSGVPWTHKKLHPPTLQAEKVLLKLTARGTRTDG